MTGAGADGDVPGEDRAPVRPGVRRTALAVALVAALVAAGWGLSAPGMADYGFGAGFSEVAVGDTVYVGITHAEAEVRVRRVRADTVGPVRVEPVLCPGSALGSARRGGCVDGPIPAVGAQLPPIDEDGHPGESIVVLAVTRTGPGPAAVCGTRVVFTRGVRLGWATGRVEITPSEGAAGTDDGTCG